LHGNVYATHKFACSSLQPYHMLLQAFILSLKEICVATQNFEFARCSEAEIVNCNESTICRNKQLTMTTMPMMTELPLKRSHDCHQP
jgi:hypothetical protein